MKTQKQTRLMTPAEAAQILDAAKRKKELDYLRSQVRPRAATPMQAKPIRKPLTQAEAAQILDGAIRRKMEAEKVSYAVALSKLQQEKPALVEGYAAVVRRTQPPKQEIKND